MTHCPSSTGRFVAAVVEAGARTTASVAPGASTGRASPPRQAAGTIAGARAAISARVPLETRMGIPRSVVVGRAVVGTGPLRWLDVRLVQAVYHAPPPLSPRPVAHPLHADAGYVGANRSPDPQPARGRARHRRRTPRDARLAAVAPRGRARVDGS